MRVKSLCQKITSCGASMSPPSPSVEDTCAHTAPYPHRCVTLLCPYMEWVCELVGVGCPCGHAWDMWHTPVCVQDGYPRAVWVHCYWKQVGVAWGHSGRRQDSTNDTLMLSLCMEGGVSMGCVRASLVFTGGLAV